MVYIAISAGGLLLFRGVTDCCSNRLISVDII